MKIVLYIVLLALAATFAKADAVIIHCPDAPWLGVEEPPKREKPSHKNRNAVIGIAAVLAVGVTVHIALGREHSKEKRVKVSAYADTKK